jgi:hypothetical protein
MSEIVESTPSATLEYVWLPDPAACPTEGETASFHADGSKAPAGEGTVLITTLGVQFVWARFWRPVKAGQVATMVFRNLNTSFIEGGKAALATAASLIDGAATEWDPSTHQPVFGEAVVELIAVERGLGVGRIVCRNTYRADLQIAAGIAAPIALFLPPPDRE